MLRFSLLYDRNGRVRLTFPISHNVLPFSLGISRGTDRQTLPFEMDFVSFAFAPGPDGTSGRSVYADVGELFDASIESRRFGDAGDAILGAATTTETTASMSTREELQCGDDVVLLLEGDVPLFNGEVTEKKYNQGDDTYTYTLKAATEDGSSARTWTYTDALSFSESLNPADYYNQILIERDTSTTVVELPVSYSWSTEGGWGKKKVNSNSVFRTYSTSDQGYIEEREKYTTYTVGEGEDAVKLRFLTQVDSASFDYVESDPPVYYGSQLMGMRKISNRITQYTIDSPFAAEPYITQEITKEWSLSTHVGRIELGGNLYPDPDGMAQWLQLNKVTQVDYSVKTFSNIALVIRRITEWKLESRDGEDTFSYSGGINVAPDHTHSYKLFPMFSTRWTSTYAPPVGQSYERSIRYEYTEEVDGDIVGGGSTVSDRARLSDFLPPAKQLETVREETDKRTYTFKDADSIDRLGLRERVVRLPDDVTDDAVIQAYGTYLLGYYAKCVEGSLNVSLNPIIRSGDTVVWAGATWDVDSATHDIGSWETQISMRRTPKGYEIVDATAQTGHTPEEAIVQILRDATARVDNAAEMTITERLARGYYMARNARTGTIEKIKADYSIYGSLPIGASILVGRSSR